jgi:DNA-binding NtrC family response regulator
MNVLISVKGISMDDSLVFRKANGAYEVLIVEDDAPDQIIVEQQIKALWPNSKTVAATCLRDAIKILKNQSFDMVLLDLNLRDTLGPKTVYELRKIAPKVPVIVMTGMLTSITADEALKFGANNIVPKSQIMEPDFFNILEQNAG